MKTNMFSGNFSLVPLTFTGPWNKKCLAEFGIVTDCGTNWSR
jgi:hypothetical protein